LARLRVLRRVPTDSSAFVAVVLLLDNDALFSSVSVFLDLPDRRLAGGAFSEVVSALSPIDDANLLVPLVDEAVVLSSAPFFALPDRRLGGEDSLVEAVCLLLVLRLDDVSSDDFF
jgi:hypothetical protein